MIAFALYTPRRARRFICPWGLFIWSYGKHWPARSRPITYGNGGIRLTFLPSLSLSPFLSIYLQLTIILHISLSLSLFLSIRLTHYTLPLLVRTFPLLFVSARPSFISSLVFLSLWLCSSNTPCNLLYSSWCWSLLNVLLSQRPSLSNGPLPPCWLASAFIGPAAYHNTNDRWTFDPCSTLLPPFFLSLSLCFQDFLCLSHSLSAGFSRSSAHNVHRRTFFCQLSSPPPGDSLLSANISTRSFLLSSGSFQRIQAAFSVKKKLHERVDSAKWAEEKLHVIWL